LLVSDTLVYESKLSFSVNIISDTSFNFIRIVEGEEIEPKQEYFGKNISTEIGDILITPNTSNVSKHLGQTIYVQLSPIKKVAEYYRNEVSISPAAEGSKVLNLSLNDHVVDKSKNVLDFLVDEYNTASIEDKSAKSNSTAEFIDKRIDLIATDLGEADNKIEQFKTGNTQMQKQNSDLH